MPKIRASWLILITVIAITAAVPPLRRLGRRQFAAALERPTEGQTVAQFMMAIFMGRDLQSPSAYGERWYMHSYEASVNHRSLLFVAENHPGDPEMWTAAAHLTAESADTLERDGKEQQATALREKVHEAFRRAATLGDLPASWAAYAAHVLQYLECRRIGESGVDPGDPQEVARERRLLEDRRLSDTEPSITQPAPYQAAEALAALRGWQHADPDNAVPIALQAWVLYSLHQDQEALDLLKKMAEPSVATDRAEERGRALRALLLDMGFSPLEASFWAADVHGYPSIMARLRSVARISSYEGRLAQLEGRAQDAIDLWNSAYQLGRSLSVSADTIVEYLVGAAIQGIAIHPIWSWRADRTIGLDGGPLLGGRLWYGPQHDFYVAHVGREAAHELRDSFIQTKLRCAMTRSYVTQNVGYARYTLAGYMSFIGQLVAAQAVPLLLLLLLLGLFGRRYPIPARRRRLVRRFLLAPLVITALAIGWALGGALAFPDSPIFPGLPASFVALPGILVFLATLIFALITRGAHIPFLATWAESIRRVVPPLIALLSVAYLAISVGTVTLQQRVVADMAQNEMALLMEAVGPSWHNPPIPPDSYRAEYPPQQP